ncbi:cutinase family protein [Rhodococcus sp. D-46]|uniref:cutinase family protein n=1 Tax=unclassified Rhodococcus (in: high G+C Gram-positive bacteria) TaxID=192944 RepID=UPI0006BA3CF9|nr:cutinase family protein [Rhodococcus sp. ADH]KPH21085.1 cutinase [Rhodococcus sp. ADH]NHE68858.1 cutinase family protein [Rhodococcus sp. D-46]
MPFLGLTIDRPVCMLMTATVVAASIALMSPGIASAQSNGCSKTFNLVIPGTWETSEDADPSIPVGMLKPIADSLAGKHGSVAQIYTLPYMARAFDNGKTYADSKSDGSARAKDVISEIATKCSGIKFTITGYSQGADIAGDLATAIGNGSGPIKAEQVLAVGLLADPGSGTNGEALIGPKPSGKGIAGPRPQGMGKLSGRVASICDPKDLYCSIQKGSSPLLGSLGSVLTDAPSNGRDGQVDGNSYLATALASDFSQADLPGLAKATGNLTSELSKTDGTVDLEKVASRATTLANTISPLAELLGSGAANPAANGQLAAAPAGSAENNASQVLDKAGQSDLSSALSTVTAIADTASKLASKGSTTLPVASPDLTSLSTAAGTLDSQIAPLATTPSDVLGSASGVLSLLKPTVVVNQVLNVATGVASLDMPAILANLNLLPQKVAALDAQGAHKIAGDLNNQFSPLVKMAAGVDLKWVSQILSVIPDPSGYSRVAALVASILGGVDIIKLANLVGQVQEIAWAAVEKLLPPPGQLPDPLAAGATMTGLVPVGLELASVAVNMLSGKATKTDPTLLGKQSSTAASTDTAQAQDLDLPALAGELTTMANSQGANDLASLVGEGLEAASFLASGAHQNYNSLVVDNAGRNAIQWISEWLNLQIGRAT